MTSILSNFNPITKEDLIRLGFKTKLSHMHIDERYDLSIMSDEEMLQMINENIYYEKRFSNYYEIIVRYWPNTFHTDHFTVDFGEITLSNIMTMTNDPRKPYNLEITCVGRRYNPTADHKIYAEDLKDITDYLSIAKFESEPFSLNENE